VTQGGEGQLLIVIELITLCQHWRRWRKEVKGNCSSWFDTVCKNSASKVYCCELSE